MARVAEGALLPLVSMNEMDAECPPEEQPDRTPGMATLYDAVQNALLWDSYYRWGMTDTVVRGGFPAGDTKPKGRSSVEDSTSRRVLTVYGSLVRAIRSLSKCHKG